MRNMHLRDVQPGDVLYEPGLCGPRYYDVLTVAVDATADIVTADYRTMDGSRYSLRLSSSEPVQVIRTSGE